MFRNKAAVLWLVLAFAVMPPLPTYAQKRNQITGQVVDKDNHPISGVSVKISRGSEVLDRQRTDKYGQYTLRFASGSPISALLYECLDCYPCAIFNVSGSKDHNITKVIIKEGTALSVNEHSEIEATLEYLTNSSNISQAEREQYADLKRTLPSPVAPLRIAPTPFAPMYDSELVVALLNNLTVKKSRRGDKFSVVVREPKEYEGALIGGSIAGIHQGKDKSAITIMFDSITMPDGQEYSFEGQVEEVILPSDNARSPNSSTGKVSGEDTIVIKRSSTTNALVGALIGELLRGGQGAAVGAAIGAGVGVTSTIAKRKGELNLMFGTKLKISPYRRSTSRGQRITGDQTNTGGNITLNKALKLYEAGRDDEALKAAHDVLRGDLMNAEAYLLIGRINKRRGDLIAAISALRTAIFWDAKMIDAHILLGHIFLERGDRAKAIAHARYAILIDPNKQEAIALQRQIERTAK